MRACLLARTVCRRGCWPSVCEPGETAVSRAGCLPWADDEWLECRLSRPGRVEPGGGLGELEATAAEGMAAGVGCDVEAALGIVEVVVAAVADMVLVWRRYHSMATAAILV
jgi:hypothetical protein